MLLTCYYSIEVEEVCLHIAVNNRLRLLPVPNLYFLNFGGAFVRPKTVKNNIAGIIIYLKSVMR